ncbi:MAG: 3-phosphoshikimate 1-carboxyvinyltransferase [Alphaproteobacteria bacterium]|nr:3-phosphoshikimate 1-carboxyvinyltransferase [Alphaproteobacteria bacterium]
MSHSADFEPEFDAESPWTALKGVSSVRVAPAEGPLIAEVTVPGSKSFSNRALILAGFAEGESVLTGLLKSDDTYWCADAITRLGARVRFDGDICTITGIGRDRPVSDGRLHVGSAGTIARFLPGFLVAGGAGEWTITSSRQMARRPVGPLFDALKSGGAAITSLGQADCYPAKFRGGSFAGGRLEMAGNVSSQFISGLLLAAPHTREGVELAVTSSIVQSDYVRITIETMNQFGVDVVVNDEFNRFSVNPQPYRGMTLAVEADASTATYFAALAAVTRGDIILANIGEGTRQPDFGFIAILARLGCTVEKGAGWTRIVCSGPLKGGFEINMKPLSDATLTLAAIAPFADAPIAITNVGHIRHHESDRIAAICTELARAGIKVEEHPDGLTVYPGTPRFAVHETYEDHRVAMALAVMGAGGAGAELKNPGCVSKTCPSFFDELAKLGIGVSAR